MTVEGGLVTGDGRVASLTVHGGTLQPGVQGLGTLDVTGNAFIGEGATARFTVSSAAAHTALRVEGNFGLGSPTLELAGAGAAAPGASITLVQHAGNNR